MNLARMAATKRFHQTWKMHKILPADLRQKVNSGAAKLNLPVAEALQKAFVEKNAVFHNKSISKYGPNLKKNDWKSPWYSGNWKMHFSHLLNFYTGICKGKGERTVKVFNV